MVCIVLIIGSNPSQSSINDNAFDASTKSRRTIDEWFKDIPCDRIYSNLSDKKTEGNRQLRKEEVKLGLNRVKELVKTVDKVIAMGKTASAALTKMGIVHYEMPHPSGLNRLLNDKKYVEEKIKGLQEFILQPD